MIDLVEVISLLAVGLGAGAIGGMVGVGGSIVIIPVLTLVMHHDQHLSQAAAMIVNVFVAAPALVRHHRADAVRWDIMVRMLPWGLVLIVVGVWASNQFDGEVLKKPEYESDKHSSLDERLAHQFTYVHRERREQADEGA